MKFVTHYCKQLIVTSFFVIAFLGVFHQASAQTYQYTCLDSAEKVFTYVTIDKSVFKENISENFVSSGQVTSYCSSRLITLKVKNKNKLTEPESVIIPNTFIYQGDRYPGVPSSTTFTSPVSQGTYAVRFTTSVEEVRAYACNAYSNGLYSQLNKTYTYPSSVYDMGKDTVFPLSVGLYYDVYDIPNQFDVYEYPGNVYVTTTGWKGYANYAGPWGSQPIPGDPAGNYINTPTKGTTNFTATQRYYKIVPKTVTGPTLTDNWQARIVCP